jgi:hypothetical protein
MVTTPRTGASSWGDFEQPMHAAGMSSVKKHCRREALCRERRGTASVELANDFSVDAVAEEEERADF